ncbi:erythromycin esterase family protein [Paenisporosarcina quisquiliarum]|uniref:Erythromycin esterase family protein n=1 Tax=Paenisporosarcina quisquiliarum TaxID=365346 RepID=A0A9X3LG12_9BACL|nr:erythromycin esterase family protein [Paenisporosarcina quisquiliarum]MCZ8537072.1 erythromycin esterase family protein [Paenisporosarcina quisquiliarum]
MSSLEQSIKKYARPFETEKDLSTIIEAIGDAKIVLLGEASHGTSEFYSVRAELSKRLVLEKGFTLIAVEGDWPSSQQVNHYIKGYSEGKEDVLDVLKAFNRWPTWMWANEEMADFILWLKEHNVKSEESQRVGFYGIDVYSLWESLDEVITYLSKTNPGSADLELAKKAFACFEPFNRHPETYAMSSINISEACVDEVSKLLKSIRAHEDNYNHVQEADLNLKINAMVAQNAEEYYRAMVCSDDISWNVRDEHMVEVINEVMDYNGHDAKIIVWEHNTHIGDASATDMEAAGMVNVGQILRLQNRKENVYSVGFGTYKGTVIAAEQWAEPFKIMKVPVAMKDSWEHAMHAAGDFNQLLIFDDDNRHLFDNWIGHRAIGVVYNPEFEAYGNYVPSKMGSRYDAFIYLDETKALTPIE